MEKLRSGKRGLVMKDNRYLIIGLASAAAVIIGLIAASQLSSSREMMPGGMMMGNGGMMKDKGMMGGMMKNMGKIDQKTKFSSNGERIFFTGINSNGEKIKNSHGMEGVGCAMCHGSDGGGMRMMMMEVPSLKWQYLTDPKGHTHAGGRTHPSYTEPSFNPRGRIGKHSLQFLNRQHAGYQQYGDTTNCHDLCRVSFADKKDKH